MTFRITKKTLVHSALILAVFALSLVSVLAEQLPVKTYTIADGLARDFINKIKQDPNGYLWFCTAEGISRFDGYDFTNYGVADGLPHRVFNDILIKRDGTYLFGTEGGLVQFNPATESFVGDDEASTLLGRKYRAEGHWAVPKPA